MSSNSLNQFLLTDQENQLKFSLQRISSVLTLVAFGCCAMHAADPPKKSSPAPKAAPAKVAAPAGGAKPGAAGAATSHGPTTAGSHGPTTAGAHGPTTAATHGPTTAGTHPTTTTGTHTPAAGASPRNVASANHTMTTAGHVGVPAGNRVVKAPGGSEVRMRPNGKPGDVHVAGRDGRSMDIHHGLAGGRRVEVERPDHTRIVADRGGRSYVQHSYSYQGHEYASRTYVYNNVVYNRYYAGYEYRGVYMNVYSPAIYYAPAFYGWAYNPWAAPIAYSWGWAANPWYGYYGFYFNPYPVYPSASAWLVDYMVSQSLAASYQAQIADANASAAQANAAAAQANAAAAQAQASAAQAQANASSAPPPGATAMTPEVKDLISQEVQRQIALENTEAKTAQASGGIDPSSSGLQRMLTDGIQHAFVAGRSIDVTDSSNAECAITEGDVLQLSSQNPPDATVATLVVLCSKGGQECRTGATVSVALTELQEMQNHMRETIDQGMGELQAKQSKGGLPALPVSATAPPVKAPAAAAAPPPDPAAATEIAQEAKQADSAEKQVLSQVSNEPSTATLEASSAPAPPAAPPGVLSIGQTIDQVTAIEGAPKSKVELGAKQIYLFSDGLKVTFKDGKVSDVQ